MMWLVLQAGEAIGINTWTVKDGISFSIPSDYAKKFIERSDAYAQKSKNSCILPAVIDIT